MVEENFKNTTFEEKMNMLYSKMSEKQMKDSRKQIMYMCKDYCGKCPSYKGTGEVSLAFCINGKSSIITEPKTCLCGQCPISKMMSLRWGHYCTNGSAIELSQSEK
ncbi:MAG: DUF2769 domain-containing protein [Candidatus Helarchaeota archaeon]